MEIEEIVKGLADGSFLSEGEYMFQVRMGNGKEACNWFGGNMEEKHGVNEITPGVLWNMDAHVSYRFFLYVLLV